ncbi:1240_t:CDS:2 [Entrophospora sp. SA101]|nr:1240_t:CDS:2 [Entrophospora sp. SA101]
MLKFKFNWALNSTTAELVSPSTKRKSEPFTNTLTLPLGLPITERIYPENAPEQQQEIEAQLKSGKAIIQTGKIILNPEGWLGGLIRVYVEGYFPFPKEKPKKAREAKKTSQIYQPKTHPAERIRKTGKRKGQLDYDLKLTSKETLQARKEDLPPEK